MPLSAAVNVGLDAEDSGFVEPPLGPVGSPDLSLDGPPLGTCTVRSGTNFGFAAAAAEALFVCSRSGALSDDLAVDLDVVVLGVAGVFFLPAPEEVDDRRLKS